MLWRSKCPIMGFLIRILITEHTSFYFSCKKSYLLRTNCEFRENAVELLQRYRRDRRVLLDYILSGSLIKKVIMPPGAVALDDVDLDQVSVDYVLSCSKKGDEACCICFWACHIFC